MNTGLLFSSFPFIAGSGLSLTQMTDLDLDAMWEILGDEENFRYAPTGPLAYPELCMVKLRQTQALFNDRMAVMLGIYPIGGSGRLSGIFEIYNIDPQTRSVTVRFTISRASTGKSLATGALRAAVHKKLKKLKYVKEFRLGEFGEGDTGVTIVIFK